MVIPQNKSLMFIALFHAKYVVCPLASSLGCNSVDINHYIWRILLAEAVGLLPHASHSLSGPKNTESSILFVCKTSQTSASISPTQLGPSCRNPFSVSTLCEILFENESAFFSTALARAFTNFLERCGILCNLSCHLVCSELIPVLWLIPDLQDMYTFYCSIKNYQRESTIICSKQVKRQLLKFLGFSALNADNQRKLVKLHICYQETFNYIYVTFNSL